MCLFSYFSDFSRFPIEKTPLYLNNLKKEEPKKNIGRKAGGEPS
jgi:hypothetical protein